MKYPFIGRSEQGNHYVFFGKCKVFSLLSKAFMYEKDGFGELENVTAEYLRNTKIKVLSPEHSEMIQKLVFNAGGEWVGSGRIIMKKDMAVLYIDNDLHISYGHTYDERFFNSHKNKEITLPLPPKGGKEMEGGCRGIGVIEEILGCKLESKSVAEQEKPIYTREMHERGELPPVGSEVDFGGRTVGEVLINKPDASNHILVNFDGHYHGVKVDKVKPLPTPEDKLTDALLPIIVENTRETSGYASLQITKAIINGEIDGVKWEG